MSPLTDLIRPNNNSGTAHLLPAAAVAITRLMLTDFRNYEHLNLELDPRPVALAGHNGAGKTNILEALSYLSAGRGMRNAKLGDVGRRGVEEMEGRPWAVAGELETASGSVRLGSGIDPASPDRRAVHINGKAVKGAAALAQHISAVWVTPSMDRIFTDTPGERRRFLDRLVSVLDTEHRSRVAAYDQANRRRTRLFRDGVTDYAWFNALEDTMARYGVSIAAARRDAVAQLNGVLAEEEGPFPSAQLGLSGTIDAWLDTMAAVDAEEALHTALAEDRKACLANREPLTAQGPNRSDLIAFYADTGRAAEDCSTGEQKALLVSIILAHVRLQTARRGQPPLVLLDEVAAHLDPERQQHLFERLASSGIQVWMTGTDLEIFSAFGEKIQMFTIAEGRITRTPSVPLANVFHYPRMLGERL